MPRESRYRPRIGKIINSQEKDGATPLINAKIIMTIRLINMLITAVSVAETTTMYFGKLILRSKSPRTTIAWMPCEVHSVKKLHIDVPQRR